MTESLAHHGVKGMKWGVHKNGEAISAHPDYTKSHQRLDREDVGNAGARRINKRMHAGQSHAEARKAEFSRRAKKRAVVSGTVVAGHILAAHGPTLVKHLTSTRLKSPIDGQLAIESKKSTSAKTQLRNLGFGVGG